ncbi:MAG: tryptophan-rich sensory protein [Bacteroidota bacterium]
MKKLYALLNFSSIAAVIYWNYYINTRGINGNTVGSLSDEYANLFTPAGYAFAIWGIIFLALLALGIFQLWVAFANKADTTILQMGPWLLIANIGNCLWLWFWLQMQTAISVFIMLLILVSLLQVVFRLQMQITTRSRSVYLFTWLPISLYVGWISVATIANIAAYLAKIGWSGGWSETGWAALMIIVALAVNLFVLFNRNMNVFAGVGIWALLAIAVRHWEQNAILQWIALASAVLLAIAIVYNIIARRRYTISARYR